MSIFAAQDWDTPPLDKYDRSAELEFCVKQYAWLPPILSPTCILRLLLSTHLLVTLHVQDMHISGGNMFAHSRFTERLRQESSAY